MKKRYAWLVSLLVIAVLVAACGPQMATPTPEDVAVVGDGPTEEAPTAAAQEDTPTATATEAQSEELGSLVQSDDWHILGSADAPVTIVDFSDFQ
jgi:hypothetical protein